MERNLRWKDADERFPGEKASPRHISLWWEDEEKEQIKYPLSVVFMLRSFSFFPS